ncbi:hypothetical protein KAJ77_12045, partial [bacterium]|nr:hypothetical protein [bacterium]
MIHDFPLYPFFRNPWWRSTSLVLVFVLLVFSRKVQAADTLISGTVRAADGGSLNGLVMIEKGRLYGKNFRYGSLVQNGRFSVRVDG